MVVTLNHYGSENTDKKSYSPFTVAYNTVQYNMILHTLLE